MDENNVNLSKFVNEHLFMLMSIDNEEDLIEKKSELETKIKLLDKRMEDIRALNLDGTKKENAKKQALAELRSHFSARMENERPREDNLNWILAPQNIGRCKILEKIPENVLDELEAWNDGKETS